MKLENIKEIRYVEYKNKKLFIMVVDNLCDNTYEYWIGEEGYGKILFMFGIPNCDEEIIKEGIDFEYWIERIEED